MRKVRLVSGYIAYNSLGWYDHTNDWGESVIRWYSRDTNQMLIDMFLFIRQFIWPV